MISHDSDWKCKFLFLVWKISLTDLPCKYFNLAKNFQSSNPITINVYTPSGFTSIWAQLFQVWLLND